MDNLPDAPYDPGTWVERLTASLRAERDSVHQFLASQEKRLEQAESSLQELLERFEEAASHPVIQNTNAEAGEPDEDYQRRYELALDDLRELKASNAVLQDQLAKARASATSLAKQSRTAGPQLDWEAEKRRILAALESDFDPNDAKQRAERLKIEDVVEATDRAIAEKDDLIQNLQQQLDELGKAGHSEAEKAAVLAKAVDSDTVIQEERKRLKELQDECQAKLARAEIELSLERAKLARERVELEERLRSAETIVSTATALANAAGSAGSPPTRGNWMSRLGLTEADRERGKRS